MTLAAARVHAQTVLTDMVTVRRLDRTDTGDLNEGTWIVDPVSISNPTIYSGIGRINGPTQQSPTREVSGDTSTVSTHRARLPVTATGIRPGDTLTVDSSDDPDLVGAVFDVVDVRHATNAVTRLVGLRQTTRSPGIA